MWYPKAVSIVQFHRLLCCVFSVQYSTDTVAQLVDQFIWIQRSGFTVSLLRDMRCYSTCQNEKKKLEKMTCNTFIM